MLTNYLRYFLFFNTFFLYYFWCLIWAIGSDVTTVFSMFISLVYATKSFDFLSSWANGVINCYPNVSFHNDFLNVYFPSVCDKILQFSWHLSKRRDILLALENLSFSNLSSQKITKQFFDTLIFLNAILKADERKKEIKITETFLNNKLLLDRILRTSLSYGVSDE